MADSHWRHVHREGMAPINVLSEGIRNLDAAGTIALPNLRRGNEVIVSADYGPDNPSRHFTLFSFFVMSSADIPLWHSQVNTIRELIPELGESVPEYKHLRPTAHRPKLRAAPLWLDAANKIPGLLFSLAMPITQLNLWTHDGSFDGTHPDLVRWQHWNPVILLRALTAAHTIGLLTAGLAGFSQRITWITDRDSMTDKEGREQDLQQLFRDVMRLYVTRLRGKACRPDHEIRCYTNTTATVDGRGGREVGRRGESRTVARVA